MSIGLFASNGFAWLLGFEDLRISKMGLASFVRKIAGPLTGAPNKVRTVIFVMNDDEANYYVRT